MASQRPTHGGYDSVDFQSPNPETQDSERIQIEVQPPPLYPPSGSQTPPKNFVLTPGSNAEGSSQRYDVEQACHGLPEKSEKPQNSSWDLYSRVKNIEHSYEDFETRNATQAHFVYAEGDVPKSQISKAYNYLLNASIVTRWIIFIVPFMGALWIPGILGLTKFPHATIWGVELLWWSIWLSILWGGWWAALATSWILPGIIRYTVGMVAVTTRRYIDWLSALHRYIALFLWSLALWVSFNPLIKNHGTSNPTISLIGKLTFVIYLSSALLLFEKFSIQWIAGKFHERSYAERIADQKFAVHTLVVLYRYSVDNHGRSDVPISDPSEKPEGLMPRRILKRALNSVKTVASSTTTVFGDVASEIMGSPVLQPHSPKAMVKTALESANKSRLLARRLFYSFAKPGADVIVAEDIMKFFPNTEEADAAFALIDKDSNGDATREDMEMICLDLHREQLSLEHSMQDLDSAVGRLDNILMTLYFFVVILIITVALDAQLQTLIAAAGTLVLGLSWLIGASLQEVLASIIFLFIKHPFDVGDRISVNNTVYTVKEIFLLSSVFVDPHGTLVQAPNTLLNSMFIQNYRRSPQMSETFSFDVSYATTFDQLENLRGKMIEFLRDERRDFQPVFDVSVVDFPEQGKMTLTAEIKYKSNWQQGALKAQRRNKWICTLKQTLAEVMIFGPGGDPNANPDTKRYTLVPWEEVQEEERKVAKGLFTATEAVPVMPTGGWKLSDKNAVILDNSEDVFGDSDEGARHLGGSQSGKPGVKTTLKA